MKLLCRIRDLQHDITAFEAAFERRNGINLNEGMALCTLAGRGCLPSGQLADALGLSPSNTSKVLRSLEGKGLVACSSGEQRPTADMLHTDRRRTPSDAVDRLPDGRSPAFAARGSRPLTDAAAQGLPKKAAVFTAGYPPRERVSRLHLRILHFSAKRRDRTTILPAFHPKGNNSTQNSDFRLKNTIFVKSEKPQPYGQSRTLARR